MLWYSAVGIRFKVESSLNILLGEVSKSLQFIMQSYANLLTKFGITNSIQSLTLIS